MILVCKVEFKVLGYPRSERSSGVLSCFDVGRMKGIGARIYWKPYIVYRC